MKYFITHVVVLYAFLYSIIVIRIYARKNETNTTSFIYLNKEAVEVLRTTPNQVELKVCRPPPDVLSCVSPISEVPPPPPRREPPNTLNFSSSNYGNSPEDDCYHGVSKAHTNKSKPILIHLLLQEFEVTLTKIQGSLGFTLRKEDDSALGHYVRALVREPALTDGRIHAGDKIIAVCISFKNDFGYVIMLVFR